MQNNTEQYMEEENSNIDAKSKKVWWKKLLFPPIPLLVIVVTIATVWLIYSFIGDDVHPVLVYGSYPFSTYALAIVVVRMPALIKGIKNKLYSNKYSERFLEEDEFRATVTLYAGSFCNILYALFYLGAGIYFKSIWMDAIAVYYIVLSFIRIGLIRKDRIRAKITDKREQKLLELKSSFICGCLLFVLNITISGISMLMIWENEYYRYPGLIIYAQATYSFILLTAAIVNMIKFRHMKRPILSAGKIVTMVCALTSIQALQATMLVEFGDGNMDFIQLMNTLTGVAVFISVFVMAIWLIVKTRREYKLIKGEI